jgi:dolichol-phosphate mannosyltransferase
VKYSIIIPARDEAEGIATTVHAIADALAAEHIDYELIVVDDASADSTAEVVERISRENPRVVSHRSHNPPGFGFAIRAGLDIFTGDAVAIVMADGSDSPADIIAYYRALDAGHECVFGSRFMRGSQVIDYPRPKLIMNRIVNAGIRVLFRHGYNDTTNAFKAYRREVIETAQPLLSNQFNLTVELPLKAVARGHEFTVIPISWTNRAAGQSKLRLQEMGSRYAFIVLYVWLERLLSRGDYRRRQP